MNSYITTAEITSCSQCDLALAILIIRGTVTTDELEYLGIKSPSSVICKLRQQGFEIATRMKLRYTYKYEFKLMQAEYVWSEYLPPANWGVIYE